MRKLSKATSSFATESLQDSADDQRAADPDAPKRGDVRRAYAASLLRRCVKKMVMASEDKPEGDLFVDPTGIRVRVERFKPFGMPFGKLHEFGCPLGVTLYLHFLVEAGLAFLLMALVALPATIDAWLRNLRRLECRELVQAASGAAINSTDLAACGYAGIALRASLPSRSWWHTLLLPAVGTCMEYAPSALNVSTAQVTNPGAFVDLGSQADFCADGASGLTGGMRAGGLLLSWSLALNTLIFALYLMRVRRMQALRDTSFFRETLTAADFAVMVTGLSQIEYGDDASDHIPALERSLRTDLARLGFDADDLDHIELGRDCGRELTQLKKLAALRARREELRFQLALLHEKHALEEAKEGSSTPSAAPSRFEGHEGGLKLSKAARAAKTAAEKRFKAIAAVHDALEKVAASTNECRQQLRRLRSETHITTGHAFIVFQRVRDRYARLRTAQGLNLAWCLT